MIVSEETSSAFENLKLPDDIEIVYICKDNVLIESAMSQMIAEVKSTSALTSTTNVAFGSDLEWNPFVANNNIDVFRIAYEKKVYLLHISNS